MSRERQRHHRLVRRGLWYSLALCLAILLLGGVGFWALEPGIHTLQDGLWLAFTTAATVGYGDTVPRTEAGRVFAVLVVLLGLAVLSLVTASLAALFVERDVENDEHQIERDLMREIRLLRDQVDALEKRLPPPVEPAPHTERRPG
jgi:voltage-gated potassium channel